MRFADTNFARLPNVWSNMKRQSLILITVFSALSAVQLYTPSAQAKNACSVAFEPSAATSQESYSFLSYYKGKLREATQLDATAPTAVMLRALIMSTTTSVEKVYIPLNQLAFIHPITRESSMEKSQKRVQSLKEISDEISDDAISHEMLSQAMPSKNALRVIQAEDLSYVVFDGNGRLLALKKVFDSNPNFKVEVELFKSNSSLLKKTLERLRKMRDV